MVQIECGTLFIGNFLSDGILRIVLIYFIPNKIRGFCAALRMTIVIQRRHRMERKESITAFYSCASSCPECSSLWGWADRLVGVAPMHCATDARGTVLIGRDSANRIRPGTKED